MNMNQVLRCMLYLSNEIWGRYCLLAFLCVCVVEKGALLCFLLITYYTSRILPYHGVLKDHTKVSL